MKKIRAIRARIIVTNRNFQPGIMPGFVFYGERYSFERN